MHVNVQELKIEMVRNDIKSISELANRSGISRITLGKIINGGESPSAQTMEKLIATFGWSGARAGDIFFAEELT